MSAPIPVFGDRPKAVATPKLRALVKFPGNITGTTGIEVTKQNGTVTIETDWTDFGSISAIPTSPTSYILTFDSATGAYVLVPSHLLGGATAGIADAPINGIQYGRQSGAWTPVPAGVADAPSDGNIYGRQNATWVGLITDYATKSIVQTSTVPSTTNYLRIAGYNTPGDLGAALYKKVGSAPAHNGKIQSADGAWWEIAEKILTVQMFGGAADNSTDNVTPLLNALGAGGNYPCVYFPKGIYNFNSQVSFTTNFTSFLSLFGDGPLVSELRWPGVSNGLQIICGGSNQGFHVRDLGFTTGSPASGTAIDINQTTGGTYSSRFCNLLLCGVNLSADYWSTAINLLRLSNCVFDQVFVSGPSSVGGTGVEFAGTVGAAPAVFNFTDCTFNFLEEGLVFGDWAQGVTVKGCNFTNNANGIVVTAGVTGQDQLSVSNSQFGINNSGSGITIFGRLRDLNVSGSLFLFDFASAISYGDGFLATIHGNNFSAGGNPGSIALNISGNTAEGGGPITGNTFYNIGTGVLLSGGTSGWTVYGNTYVGIITHVNNGAGAANKVGVITD